jgi:sugar lactone lactonase YvrE
MFVFLCANCRTPSRAVFEDPTAPLVWPSPPQPARIRYVGQLATSDDLKASRSGLENLRRVFVGRKPPSPLYGPRAVVVTSDGERVWIADPGGRCLHLFDLKRRAYLKVNALGKNRLRAPVGVCVGSSGSIFVCDSEGGGVYRLDDRNGRLIEALRVPDELQRPVAMYYEPKTDDLYVVDASGHDLKVLGMGGELRRVIGRRGSGPGDFNFPSAIAGGENRLWIADTGNHRVQGITLSGEPLAAFGQAGDAPGDLALPKSVAVDPAGNLYVVDGRFENIQIFDTEGRLLLFLGEEGSGPGQFWLPGGIFIEPGGRIWVCDSYNRRLQVFQYVPEQ